MEIFNVFFESFTGQAITVTAGALVALLSKKIRFVLKRLVSSITFAFKRFFIPYECPLEGSILKTLKSIQAELHPNGGSSLRDAVNRVEKTVIKMNEKINTIQASTDIMSDTLNVCRWSANDLGEMIFVNRPLKKLFGAQDDGPFFGDAWINCVHEDDRDKVWKEWQRAVKAQSEFHMTFRGVHLADKHEIKLTCHGKLVVNEKNEVSGWVGVVVPHKDHNATQHGTGYEGPFI